MGKHKRKSVKEQIANFDLTSKTLKETIKENSSTTPKAVIYCRVSDQQQVTK